MLTSFIGHAVLPESCPVCAHTPVTADDCIPHKSLRQTIKIWIKSQEKKRDDKDRAANAAAQAKASTATIEDTLVVQSVEQPVDAIKLEVSQDIHAPDSQEITVKHHDEEPSTLSRALAEVRSASKVQLSLRKSKKCI
jgi:hypothetical protein